MKKATIVLDIPAPEPPFEGFSQETFKFLHGLKKNNTKAWFEAHRSDYEQYLREPSIRLVSTMGQEFAHAKLPLISDRKRSLFRINRDIRFSKDKSPYKTHIGIVFPVAGLKEDEWSGMYLGFEPSGKGDIKAHIGGGCYMPSSAYLKRIRKLVNTNHKELEKLNSQKNFKRDYPRGVVDSGDSLKRMPKGYEEDHPAAKWLKMKSFTFDSALTKKDLLSPSLPDIIVKKIKAARQVLEFFAKA
ncbi:MAG: DUF2461 domain-containing protein [Bacteroidota bacterium]|nr:DUF2461 domain-containing protein [Bacteroidota bacterium]MDP4229436.1 DUF2461 domain-containing protein [Bacteroidota bacterium]MDP4236575.1 DUF2461 domain-containing protein [Bacteroidota bacterium]